MEALAFIVTGFAIMFGIVGFFHVVRSGKFLENPYIRWIAIIIGWVLLGICAFAIFGN